ncbi:hypothetical protein TSMEX_007233 [Taenia solium]|eukprot:TsM_000404400 transcript=TsM_000404400 gene=TsM_000404400
MLKPGGDFLITVPPPTAKESPMVNVLPHRLRDLIGSIRCELAFPDTIVHYHAYLSVLIWLKPVYLNLGSSKTVT